MTWEDVLAHFDETNHVRIERIGERWVCRECTEIAGDPWVHRGPDPLSVPD